MTEYPVSYARVRKLTSDLLAKQTAPPVDLDEILSELGVELRLHDTAPDISGILIRDGERKVIVVNSGHSQARRRFTIAHEIAHLLMHPGEEVHVDQGFRINLRDPRSATAENHEEVEANAFAANLLMPADWLRKAVGDPWLDLNDDSELARLAALFEVSTQAMLVRLATLLRRER